MSCFKHVLFKEEEHKDKNECRCGKQQQASAYVKLLPTENFYNINAWDIRVP